MAAILPYSDDSIDLASGMIRDGKVVAFATETVYGLGADTFNPDAIARVYELKNRPGGNPLIAHVVDLAMAKEVSDGWTRRAMHLVGACWPGPLTIILPRKSSVPANASGGLATIAVRSPRHPLARSLLYGCSRPISAPSANRSGGVSPTSAQHVASDYSDQQDLLILDGGPCTVGIESTVVDLTESKAVVRRLGSVSIERLAEILGAIEVDVSIEQNASPGSALRHYAPRIPATLVEKEIIAQVLASGPPAVVLCLESTEVEAPHVRIVLPPEADGYAAELYNAMRRADTTGCSRMVIESPPRAPGLWSAIHDRLARATSP
ncbi:MAG: threonylcarbamoyl-AMP synthase [Phycisphaerales bacterium]|nr:threonylcarbamoyl-AMP synthase [Phycisphaerales bacterium]